MSIILILFAAAAVIGIYLIASVLRNKKPKRNVAIAHGLFAASSLVFLLIKVVTGTEETVASVVLFVMAALIGIYMFYREFFSGQSELAKSAVPKPLAVLHAVVALAAFILLIVYVG